MKYYVISKNQTQELQKDRLPESFQFADIPFWTTGVPWAVTISDSGKENVAPGVSNTCQS